MTSKNERDLEDVLTEDPPIRNQKYFVLSYLVPGDDNAIKYPIFKMRGAYSTIQECEKRIKTLQVSDKYFNMYICEVGLFGALYPVSEVDKNEDIDKVYRESSLNKMISEYKKNKDDQDVEFERRKQFMAEKVKEDATETTGTEEDPVITVKNRVAKLSFQKDELTQKLEILDSVLQKDLKFLENKE